MTTSLSEVARIGDVFLYHSCPSDFKWSLEFVLDSVTKEWDKKTYGFPLYIRRYEMGGYFTTCDLLLENSVIIFLGEYEIGNSYRKFVSILVDGKVRLCDRDFFISALKENCLRPISGADLADSMTLIKKSV